MKTIQLSTSCLLKLISKVIKSHSHIKCDLGEWKHSIFCQNIMSTPSLDAVIFNSAQIEDLRG